MFHSIQLTCLLGVCLMVASQGVLRAQLPTKVNVKLVGSHKPSVTLGGLGDVWGDGNIAIMGVWTSYTNYGFGIYDISTPSAPNLIKTYNYSTTAANRFEQGVIRSNILYVGSWGGSSGGSGLHIFTITNPAAPVRISRITASTAGTVINGFDNVHTLWLERDFLYEAAHNVDIVSVKVFNVTNPAAPAFLRDITTTNTTKVHQMTVRTKGAQTVLFTSGWGGNSDGRPTSPGQTDIWDVSNVGSSPAVWLGRIYSGYNSHSSYPTPDGNTLIVCRETGGGEVKLYDITNPATIPTNPVPVATITPASMGIEVNIPHNPVVVSNYLFLSWYQNGVQIFDISDRTKPARVGFYDTFPATHASSSSFEGNWGCLSAAWFRQDSFERHFERLFHRGRDGGADADEQLPATHRHIAREHDRNAGNDGGSLSRHHRLAAELPLELQRRNSRRPDDEQPDVEQCPADKLGDLFRRREQRVGHRHKLGGDVECHCLRQRADD